MNYLVWILIISFVGIVLMISYRILELRSNRVFFSESFREKSDRRVLTFLGKNIILFNMIYHKVTSQLVKIPEMMSHKSHDVWQVFSKRVDLFFERVKGKKAISKKGSVSLYWQSVSQSKNDKN